MRNTQLLLGSSFSFSRLCYGVFSLSSDGIQSVIKKVIYTDARCSTNFMYMYLYLVGRLKCYRVGRKEYLGRAEFLSKKVQDNFVLNYLSMYSTVVPRPTLLLSRISFNEQNFFPRAEFSTFLSCSQQKMLKKKTGRIIKRLFSRSWESRRILRRPPSGLAELDPNAGREVQLSTKKT